MVVKNLLRGRVLLWCVVFVFCDDDDDDEGVGVGGGVLVLSTTERLVRWCCLWFVR